MVRLLVIFMGYICTIDVVDCLAWLRGGGVGLGYDLLPNRKLIIKWLFGLPQRGGASPSNGGVPPRYTVGVCERVLRAWFLNM